MLLFFLIFLDKAEYIYTCHRMYAVRKNCSILRVNNRYRLERQEGSANRSVTLRLISQKLHSYLVIYNEESGTAIYVRGVNSNQEFC